MDWDKPLSKVAKRSAFSDFVPMQGGYSALQGVLNHFHRYMSDNNDEDDDNEMIDFISTNSNSKMFDRISHKFKDHSFFGDTIHNNSNKSMNKNNKNFGHPTVSHCVNSHKYVETGKLFGTPFLKFEIEVGQKNKLVELYCVDGRRTNKYLDEYYSVFNVLNIKAMSNLSNISLNNKLPKSQRKQQYMLLIFELLKDSKIPSNTQISKNSKNKQKINIQLINKYKSYTKEIPTINHSFINCVPIKVYPNCCHFSQINSTLTLKFDNFTIISRDDDVNEQLVDGFSDCGVDVWL